MAAAAPAQSLAYVKLRWDANTETNIGGYNIYMRPIRGSYTPVGGTQQTSAKVEGLVPGTIYFFTVTATNVSGLESDFSNELIWRVPYLESPPVITRQPSHQIVAAAEKVVFSVEAAGQGHLRYQWRYNGNPLPRATGSSLALTNVQTSQSGSYDVIITDVGGTVRSKTASLLILDSPVAVQAPIIIQPPFNQVKSIGDATAFSVEVTNSASLPLTYIWTRAGSVVRSQVSNSRLDFLSLTNIKLPDASCYNLRISNAFSSLFPAEFQSARACLSLVTRHDSDGDGLPDDYEVAQSLAPGDPTDAAQDPDADRLSNLEEYLAGTDPRDPSSYLHVEGISLDGAVRVRFPALANRTYLVQYCDNPGEDPWRPLEGVPAISDISSASRLVEVVDPAPPQHRQRFYRLVTPMLP